MSLLSATVPLNSANGEGDDNNSKAQVYTLLLLQAISTNNLIKTVMELVLHNTKDITGVTTAMMRCCFLDYTSSRSLRAKASP